MNNILLDNFEKFLIENNCIFDKDYNIKYNTYYKTGGKVKFFLRPKSKQEFIILEKYLSENNLEFKIIGFTSNILFINEIEYSIIISTTNLTNIELNENLVSVESGYSLQDFVRVAVVNQAEGFEGLEGIPASVGGALFMNAGAYGSSISDNLVSVDCIDENNKLITLSKEDCNFSYRKSIFKSSGKYIILGAIFKLTKGNPETIAKKIETFHIARHSYQEFAFPTLGSMISMQGSPYYNVMKDDKLYVFYYWVLKYIFKNPVMNFINRKKPHNKVFNKLLLKYLKNRKGIELNYNLSIKSANILINDGTLSSKEITNYIFLIHDLVDDKFHIENEILVNPVFKVEEEFKEDLELIKEKLK